MTAGLNTGISVTLPVGISLEEWADALITDFSNFGAYSPLTDPDKWQDWASQYNRATNLIEDFPDPYGFDKTEWREWAERFVQSTL
tara:strand:+ start:1410 stop:1667 length:258 start_codon:yes stop_codon:yes gene_type:complete